MTRRQPPPWMRVPVANDAPDPRHPPPGGVMFRITVLEPGDVESVERGRCPDCAGALEHPLATWGKCPECGASYLRLDNHEG